MKRILALLLVAVMCVSLAACGSKAQTTTSNGYTRNQQGIVELTPEQFDGFCKIVELTTEN